MKQKTKKNNHKNTQSEQAIHAQAFVFSVYLSSFSSAGPLFTNARYTQYTPFFALSREEEKCIKLMDSLATDRNSIVEKQEIKFYFSL